MDNFSYFVHMLHLSLEATLIRCLEHISKRCAIFCTYHVHASLKLFAVNVRPEHHIESVACHYIEIATYVVASRYLWACLKHAKCNMLVAVTHHSHHFEGGKIFINIF